MVRQDSKQERNDALGTKNYFGIFIQSKKYLQMYFFHSKKNVHTSTIGFKRPSSSWTPVTNLIIVYRNVPRNNEGFLCFKLVLHGARASKINETRNSRMSLSKTQQASGSVLGSAGREIKSSNHQETFLQLLMPSRSICQRRRNGLQLERKNKTY